MVKETYFDTIIEFVSNVILGEITIKGWTPVLNRAQVETEGGSYIESDT